VPEWDGVHSKAEDIALHQDCNVFVSESDGGHKFEISLGNSRQAYLVCMEGSLGVNGQMLKKRDAMELVSSGGSDLPLSLRAGEAGAHFMLIEMQRDAMPRF
jgi:redox-sensitive bicupin YhaK (pirin superfamily)